MVIDVITERNHFGFLWNLDFGEEAKFFHCVQKNCSSGSW